MSKKQKMIKITSAAASVLIVLNLSSKTQEPTSPLKNMARTLPEVVEYHLVREHMDAQLKNSKKTQETISYFSPDRYAYSQIQTYANYFQIDPLFAEKLAEVATDNFASEEYLETLNIGPAEFKQEKRTWQTREAGILAYIRCLYQKPKVFTECIAKLDPKDIDALSLTEEQKQLLHQVAAGESNLKLSMITTPDELWEYEECGLTQKQFMNYIGQVMDTDPYLAPAINYAEMAYVRTGDEAPKNFNYGNYRGNGEFYTYPSKEAGMIIHVLNIMSKLGEKDVTTFVTTESGAYVHGPSSGIEHDYTWEKNVLGCYKRIITEEAELYEIPEDYLIVAKEEGMVTENTEAKLTKTFG